MENTLEQLQKQAHDAIVHVTTVDALEVLRVDFLGRKGKLAALKAGLQDMEADARKEFGKAFNACKDAIEQELQTKQKELERKQWDDIAKTEWIDVTEPAITPGHGGHEHPLYVVQDELEDLARSMGFVVMDGPELESDYTHFEALNIPAHHPARDGFDTFYINGKPNWLLRAQTSSMQTRALRGFEPPLRVIVPGKTYRNEATDASHEHTFHQLEGVMVDKEVTIGHLVAVMKQLLKGIFGQEVNVRLRPGYFPFVEPGFEMDFACLLCEGDGCSVCSQSGWIEFLGCGLMHPEVVRHGGLDPKKWQGFAFGMGLTRIVMMRYGIDDIRHLAGGDIRFLRQF